MKTILPLVLCPPLLFPTPIITLASLIILTLMVVYFILIFIEKSFLGLLLFLLFLGGILILFSYLVIILPKEDSPSNPMWVVSPILLTYLSGVKPQGSPLIFINNMQLKAMMMSFTTMLIFTMMLILLIFMILTNNLTKKWQSPMRLAT